VWSLLVKNQEVNPRIQAQLEEGHAMGWWLIEVWWRATLCQFEKCCSEQHGSDDFNLIQIAYDKGCSRTSEESNFSECLAPN